MAAQLPLEERNVRIDFKPSTHGFRFRNSFSGYPVPPFFSRLSSILTILGSSKLVHGLCGGMCFATYDFFITGTEIPLHLNVPQLGSPLYSYLYWRQLHTYGLYLRQLHTWRLLIKFVFKMCQWTALSNDVIQRLTRCELDKVVSCLNLGQLVTLVLFYKPRSWAIWENHQVLVYNYSNSLGVTNLNVYDPNFPCCDDVFIEMKTEDGEDLYTLKTSTSNLELDGFFIMPYTSWSR